MKCVRGRWGVVYLPPLTPHAAAPPPLHADTPPTPHVAIVWTCATAHRATIARARRCTLPPQPDYMPLRRTPRHRTPLLHAREGEGGGRGERPEALVGGREEKCPREGGRRALSLGVGGRAPLERLRREGVGLCLNQ
jgi:hypothetical protein